MTKEPKIFIGVERKPLNYYQSLNANICCPCGQIIFTQEGTIWHWQNGHFDHPVYLSIDEYLERQEKIKRKLDAESKGEPK